MSAFQSFDFATGRPSPAPAPAGGGMLGGGGVLAPLPAMRGWEAGNPRMPTPPKRYSLKEQAQRMQHAAAGAMGGEIWDATKGDFLTPEEVSLRGPWQIGKPAASSGAGPGTRGYRGSGFIDAHVDGSTVAPVSEAGQHMGSLDKGSMYHGLDALDAMNKDRPKVTSWGESWADAHVPKLAHGGGVPQGMPFIAGDPQADGKPNPELILPMPHGGVHVLPLKDLPKLPKCAYGTLNPPLDPSRVNMGAFDENFVPSIPAGSAAFGRLAEFQGNTMAYDQGGNLRGFSTGLPALRPSEAPAFQAPPTAESPITIDEMEKERQRTAGLIRAEHAKGNLGITEANIGLNQLRENKLPLEDIKAGLSTEWQAEQRRQQERLDKARNPEGIIVGVTPRTALRPLEPAPGMSREERQFGRMERQVMREARRDPRLAFGLLANKSEAEQAARKAAAEEQARIDAALGVVRLPTGQVVDTEATRRNKENDQRDRDKDQREADKAAIDMNFLLAEEARKQAEFAQQYADPNLTPLPIPGTNYGYVPQTKSTLPMTQGQPGLQMTELPGTGTFFPTVDGQPKLDMPFTMTSPGVPDLNIPSLNLPWAGRLPGLSVKGEAPTFKAVPKDPKAGADKAPQIKNIGDTVNPKWVQWDANRGGWMPIALLDVNQDGVPDSVVPPSAPPAAAPAPTQQGQGYQGYPQFGIPPVPMAPSNGGRTAPPAPASSSASAFIDKITKKS